MEPEPPQLDEDRAAEQLGLNRVDQVVDGDVDQLGGDGVEGLFYRIFGVLGGLLDSVLDLVSNLVQAVGDLPAGLVEDPFRLPFGFAGELVDLALEFLLPLVDDLLQLLLRAGNLRRAGDTP